MTNIQTDMVRSRLRDIRIEKGLSHSEAGQWIGLTPEQMQAIEDGQYPITARQVIELSGFYNVQVYEITNGKLSYRTPDELLEAFHLAEITEGVLMHELKVDRIRAREMYMQWLESTGREW